MSKKHKHKSKRVPALSSQVKRFIVAEVLNTWAERQDNRPLLERAETVVNTLLYLDSVPVRKRKPPRA